MWTSPLSFFEAVVSNDLWIWHAFFGHCKDTNSLVSETLESYTDESGNLRCLLQNGFRCALEQGGHEAEFYLTWPKKGTCTQMCECQKTHGNVYKKNILEFVILASELFQVST